jgi:AraC-like DNA-binding protein
MNIEKIKKLYLNEKYTIKQIADKVGLSFWSTYSLMKKNISHEEIIRKQIM